MFVFNLVACNDQEVAEAYAAGIYDVYRLRDQWNRDLTPDEIVIEKDNLIVFDGYNANHVINMLKINSENYKGDGMSYIDEVGVR